MCARRKQKELRERRTKEREEKERLRREALSVKKEQLMKTKGYQRLLAQVQPDLSPPKNPDCRTSPVLDVLVMRMALSKPGPAWCTCWPPRGWCTMSMAGRVATGGILAHSTAALLHKARAAPMGDTRSTEAAWSRCLF